MCPEGGKLHLTKYFVINFETNDRFRNLKLEQYNKFSEFKKII